MAKNTGENRVGGGFVQGYGFAADGQNVCAWIWDEVRCGNRGKSRK
jgi:hypothetical protein